MNQKLVVSSEQLRCGAPDQSARIAGGLRRDLLASPLGIQIALDGLYGAVDGR